MFGLRRLTRTFATLPPWATMDPVKLNGSNPHTVVNILDGKPVTTSKLTKVVDPMNGEHFLNNSMADKDLERKFIESQKKIPRWGLHNPIKNVSRYVMYGDVFFKIAQEMRKKEVQDFFVRLIQRVMPKSDVQCRGEVVVTRRFFENFAGDNARFLFRSFNVPGDHDGQTSSGYRWPYGNVAVIAPFNFPIEIPALQTFGALLAGNRPLLKCATKVAVCMEQFLLMAQHCGMPAQDINFINCSNDTTMRIIDEANFHMIQFTGGSEVSELIANKTNGKVRVEDAGFDWKVLGPDVNHVDYVAWTCDQDTYAASGQKCSKQSVVFVHENWVKAGLLEKMKTLAGRRKLSDLTIGPVLTWNNKGIKNHIDSLLKLGSAKVLFGGKELTNHKIPSEYGSYEATAVQVSVDDFLNNFDLCATQLFGPFQVVVPYTTNQLPEVLKILNSMKHNLTAGVVSNDPLFLDHVLGQTINGTTYAGLRARTTGAPQNHWFGPCGDPRGAGIGTKQAILHVWTCHREIIRDYGPITPNWKTPQAS